MTLRADLISAVLLLTRLPVRGRPTDPAAHAAWAWPVVGLIIGLMTGALGTGLMLMGISPGLSAGLALALGVIVTGALHEDGLADLADGFWGGFDRARRLEIMRDSRIGTYGVIALTLSLVARWTLFAEALSLGTLLPVAIGAAMTSRAAMAVMMRWLPAARDDGLSRRTGVPRWKIVAVAMVIGFAGLLLNGIVLAVLAATLTVIVTMATGWLARAKIGGQTGDVLGACQQIVEITVLAALTVR
ncbi:MAG: adenosylcobinamide-GDP ribazoletransferase [Pseudomonadota bacterium]